MEATMFRYDDTKKTINEIHTMFKEGSLIVDDSYQRRSVWGEKDKVRLIETILLQMIVPELFFWRAKTDPQTGSSITHIVDGQQRIKAISEFANGQFKLSERYLINEAKKDQFKDKFFNDLSDAEKTNFWNYTLVVIDIKSETERNEIVDVFNRLNLTNYSLNSQEKRHTKSGLFAELAEEIASEPFWGNYKLFSGVDVKRMKDVEFCANLIVLQQKGIIDQINQQVLNDAYADMQEEYPNKNEDKESIIKAISGVEQLIVSEEMMLFARRKTQLYTLFSLVLAMQRDNKEINEVCIDRLNKFVKLYSRFKNDPQIQESLDSNQKIIYDRLNNYKLASSEGSRKLANRMIRYEILSNFINEGNADLIAAMDSLRVKLGLDLSNVEDENSDEQ